MNGTFQPDKFTELTEHLTCLWGAEKLIESIHFEWSLKLRRSLGIAYPERNLVRLSTRLKESQYAPLLQEVVCHEVAHVVIFHLHGNHVSVHGEEWRELVRIAGFEPRKDYRIDSLQKSQVDDGITYDHRCLICHTNRRAKRPQPQWRCVACMNAKLDGKLVIQSHALICEAVNG